MARMIWIAAVAALAASSATAATWRPVGVERLFVTPGEAATLRWRVPAGGLAKPVSYTVSDYWGGQVASGEAKVTPGGQVEVTVKLPRGFYEIELSAAKGRFGVVSLAARPAGEADPFFCIDSAMSWLVRDEAVREGLIKALARNGIGMSRERLSWARAHTAADEWAFQGKARYEAVRRLHAASGVAVLEMFHDAPAWMGRVGKYPADLAAAARSWRTIIGRWRQTWGALEVWNEPDIFFGANLPADQYVPLVKALSWVARDAGAKLPIVGGVVAHHNRPFLDCAARNGLLACTDAVSFHTYGRAMQMEALVGRYRSWLAAHGRGWMPLWLTECGRPWRKGPDRPPADQDAASALDITMKAVEARACGVARYFAFVYPFYEERTSNFGMMGRRGTPLRSMAAYAMLTSVLSGKRYTGDLACGGSAVRRARVFAGGGETVAVLYTGSAGGKASVKLPVRPLRAAGIDGRALPVGEGGAVGVPDGLTYAWLDAAKLGEHVATETAARKLLRASRPNWRITPPPRPISPIVLRYAYDAKLVDAKTPGYRLTGETPARMAFPVRAFNLSAKARELMLDIALSPAAAKVIGEARQTVKVPAEAHADVAWELDLRDALGRGDHVAVTVTAPRERLAGLAPLAVDLRGEPRLEQVLKGYTRRLRLPIGETSRWTANIGANGRMTVATADEGHWRLTASFGEGDRWVYPYFALPDGTEVQRFAALAIRARCRGPADVRVFLWEGDGGVGYLTADPIITADGKWHTAIVPFAGLSLSTANAPDPNGRLDLDQVRRISIGLNSRAERAELDVSDAYLVGKK